MLRSALPNCRFVCALALGLGISVSQAQVVTTRSYPGPDKSITDGSGDTELYLFVDGLGNLADLDVRLDALSGCDATAGNASAAITHAAVGDLTLTLVSPNNTQVVLYDRRGGQRDNLCATLFDDDGAWPGLGTLTSVNGQTVTGNFRPDNPLSAFDGEPPNGYWRLRIADGSANAVAGTARRFSLIMTTAAPAEILVDRFDDPAPDGCTPGSCSLREAVALSNTRPGFDRIVLPAGTFQLTRAGADENANLTGDLDAMESVEIVGAGADISIVQQNSADRVLQASFGLHLRRVGLRGGRAVMYGGAVQGSDVMLVEDATFLGNSAERGGALHHADTGYDDPSVFPLTLRRVRFEGNEATSVSDVGEGGAVVADGSGVGTRYRVRVEQSQFIDNLADHRGGAFAFSGDGARLSVSDSEFSGNELTEGGRGGAIASRPDVDRELQVDIVRSRFSANRATASATSKGGAISFGSSVLQIDSQGTVTDSTFCDNVAAAAGGAIVADGVVTVSGSTFCNNRVESSLTSDPGGGAIAIESGDLSLTRSTLVNNNALRGGAIAMDNGDFVLRSSTLTGPAFVQTETLGTLLRYTSSASSRVLSLYNNVLIGSCSYAAAGINPDNARNNVEAAGDTCRLTDATISNGNQVNASSAAIDLAPLADNGGPTFTRLLRPGSIAIDAGNNAQCPPLDQRGYARSDAFCDVGAVEAGGASLPDAVFSNGFE